MSTLGQIEEAVNLIKDIGNPNLCLLHCNSTYPSPEEDMNLNVINSLKLSFGLPAGLSDHTTNITTSLLAMLLRANVLEKHFTLDKSLEGPDHILSLDLQELKKLCNFSKSFKGNINNDEDIFELTKKNKLESILQKKISKKHIKKILGDGVKIILPSEYEAINAQRKCIYAKRNITKGRIIQKQDLIIKGPAGGILPKYMDIIIGKKAKESIESDYPVTWDIL
jgi:sialic acid synthase SpsE